MGKGWTRGAVAVAGILGVFLAGSVFAVPSDPAPVWKVSRWDLRTGYGYQYTNSTRPNNFQLIEFLPSALIPLTGTVGPSWLRGRWDWNPELYGALFTHPYIRPLFGATPVQFHWEWKTSCRWKPYVLIGAGILHAAVNRRETGANLNFNLQGGIGTYVHWNDDLALILEYRHIHISNAGQHEDNAGLNTNTFLAGLSIKK